MTIEKRKKLRMINIIGFVILLIGSLVTYFLPLGKNVTDLATAHPNLINFPANTWVGLLLTLVGLACFTRFQAGNMQFRNSISAKTLDVLGWTPVASYILFLAGMLAYHFEQFILALVLLILTSLVLLITNGNIREDYSVMDEKFWVRNPFSIFTGWVFLLITDLIAKRWAISDDTNSAVFMAVVIALLALYSLSNLNIGIPLTWILYFWLRHGKNPATPALDTILLIGMIVFAVIIVVIFVRGRHKQYLRHKPVNRRMDKYNAGDESEIKKLEDDLNQQLQTKPGARINLDN